MTASRVFAIAFAALLSAAAAAQEAPAPPTDTPAMPAACMTQGTRHDHGAEKGTPTPGMSGCPMAMPTAAARTAKPKAEPGHDHARFHKLM